MSWINPRSIKGAASRRSASGLLQGEELRRKAARSCALGTFLIELPAPATLSALALAGFDFVVLDLEHSSIDLARLDALIVAAQAAGLVALVRVCGEDAGIVGRVLDLGANGIMVPHVESAARAREVVQQARFAPLGRRGFSPLSRFDGLQRPLAQLNQSTYVVLQVEGRNGLDNIEQIAAVPGVDAVFVGPYDLALSLGVPPGSPRVYAAARRAARHVPQSVALGIYVDDAGQCGAWARRRFTLQCVSFDGRIFADGARAVADTAMKALRSAGSRK